MRAKLQATVARSTGMVYADVPAECMWDLVTYLAEQRIAVSYHFMGPHFTVRFPQSHPGAAQRVLDAWAECDAGELAAAC